MSKLMQTNPIRREWRSCARDKPCVAPLGKAKVHKDTLTVVAKHDVGWPDVCVDNAFLMDNSQCQDEAWQAATQSCHGLILVLEDNRLGLAIIKAPHFWNAVELLQRLKRLKNADLIFREMRAVGFKLLHDAPV